MSSVIMVKRGYRRAVIAAGMRGAPGAGSVGSAGVSSFNTRTGPVTLVSADVSGALGYTPANSADLAGVALSGSYADLSGLPAIPAAPGDLGAATAAQGAKADTAVQPGELASVAASGSYADLSAKPFIPALPGDIGAATAAQGAKADTAVQPAALASGLDGKVDKDGTKVLSDQNYTTAEKAKLAGLEGAHFKGLHASLAALQAAHPSAAAGDYADVDSGTGADVARYIWDVSDSKWVIQSGASGSMTAAQIKTAYESNPDTNGFSDAEQSKLGAIAPGATANATDAQLRDRSTHSGTQAASTISDLAAAVRGVVMTGVSFVTATAGLATDSLLVFLGKLQAQVTSLMATVAGKQDTLVSGTTLKTVNGSSLLGAGDLSIAGGGASLPVIRAITANETLGLTSINTFGVNATINNYVSTIPAQATVAWTADAELHFLPSNTGDITITAAAGVSLNGVVAGSLTLSTQNGAATLKRTGADAWWLGGVIGTIAQQQAALGLGTAAAANLTTSNVDTTAGRVLKTGDAGVLGPTPGYADGNLLPNGIGFYCWYLDSSTGANFPLGAVQNWQGFESGGANSNRGYTMAAALGVDRLAFRTRSAGVNGPWCENWHSRGANLVTVETGSLGYGTGSGGFVTQATSKVTAVTLNKPAGRIATAADSLAAGASVVFALNNTKISGADIVMTTTVTQAGISNYRVEAFGSGAGLVSIRITNISAGALAEVISINFVVIKGATA